MANPTGKGGFKPGNQWGKGNQGAKRRVIYDRLWTESFEQNGKKILAVLEKHTEHEDPSISLRACESYFKLGRVPETIPLPEEPPLKERMLALCKTHGLTLEDARVVSQAEEKARNKSIQHLLLRKHRHGSQ